MSGINQVDIEQEIQHGIGAGLGGISGRGSAKPTIKLQVFTGEGWHLWKFKMKSYFQWMGVWEVVSGIREKPTEEASTREEIEKWNYDELTARNILLNIVDSDRLQMLTSCEIVPEMWKTLEEKYEQNSMSNKMMLDEELQALRQEGKSLALQALKCCNDLIKK